MLCKKFAYQGLIYFWLTMAKSKKSSEIGLERGQRIRRLREALRYSRQAFADKYSFSPRTLENWEEPRWDGVTVAGAQKLIRAFEGEGLHVTLEWLFFGKGHDPLAAYEKSRVLHNSDDFSDPTLITQELEFFHQLHKNIIDTVLVDDGIAPILTPGDYVAGRRLSGIAMEKAIGYLSIAQTSDGILLVRTIERGVDNSCYTLRCLNPHTTVTKPILENISLLSVAPIVWIRKVNIKI
jgi:DNA-binding transcriptional regulator YiaG